MKSSPPALLAPGIIAIAAVALIGAGTPNSRKGPVPSRAKPAATSVSANGFTLRSASIDLPVDRAMFPAGANADLVNANCTVCHSASMALSQPPMSADQWKASVTKMREIYKAPVAQEDVPAIVAYLASMPGQQAGPPTGRAQNPAPRTGPNVSGRTQ
jgi:hypothetical protein